MSTECRNCVYCRSWSKGEAAFGHVMYNCMCAFINRCVISCDMILTPCPLFEPKEKAGSISKLRELLKKLK